MAKTIKAVSSSSSDNEPDIEDSLPPVDDGGKASARNDATLDLDEYGIWVKAEPEDFEQKDSFDEKDMELEDLSLEDEGDLPSADLEGDTAVDEHMIDNLDIPEEETLPGPEDMGGEKEVALDEDLPSFDDELTLEEAEPVQETVVREDETPAVGEMDVEETLVEEPEAEAGGDFEDVSLDDLGIEISEQVPDEDGTVKKGPAAPAAPVHDVDEINPHVINDDFAALPLELDDVGEAETTDHGDLEIEDLELPDEEAVSLGGDEESMALSLDDETETGDAESLDFSLDESTDAAGPEPLALPAEEENIGSLESEGAGVDQEMLEEIPELELGADDGIELDLGQEAGGEEIEVPLSEETAIPEADEDLESLGGDLEQPAETGGADSSVLKKIESELRSIKSELTQLKTELGVLRGKKTAGRAEKSGPAAGEEGADFFEDEEDETIALTGEELDNILTTADIKEEEKAEAAPEAPEETELDLGEDILDYEEPAAEEDFAAAAPAEAEEETVSLEEESLEAPQDADEGEIEIEIPELDETAGEVPDLEASEDLESLEELELPGDAGSDASLDLETVAPLDEIGEDLSAAPEPAMPAAASAGKPDMQLPAGLKEEIKSVLGYMDQLLESLPEEKIEEFAKSEYFAIYKKLFEELGLVT
jgi:pilus assembly protein FimV